MEITIPTLLFLTFSAGVFGGMTVVGAIYVSYLLERRRNRR